MEYRITWDNPEMFDDWNSLNPDGFQYNEDYSLDDIWTQAEAKDDWFVRGYGDKQENTLAQQLEDFHVIADKTASCLMGNAMAMVDETCWADDLKTLNGHIRQIAEYVASNQRAELGPKN